MLPASFSFGSFGDFQTAFGGNTATFCLTPCGVKHTAIGLIVTELKNVHISIYYTLYNKILHIHFDYYGLVIVKPEIQYFQLLLLLLFSKLSQKEMIQCIHK